ncbi:MAG TPA: glycosyltransferase, partial [Limnochordales bacterium]
MVVLFVSDSYRPYVSGVVVSLEWTARQLARLGHQVVLAVPAPGRQAREGGLGLLAPPEAEPRPCPSQTGLVRVVTLPSLPAPGVRGFRFPLPWAAPLYRALRRWGLRPQVVHAHSPFVAGRLALHLGRQLGCPVVFTHHTLYHLYAHYGKLPQRLVRPLTWRYVARYCRRVDGVVAPSEPVRELVVRGYGVTRPVRVIPTGIHLEPFLRASPGPARQRLGLRHEEPL